jgi:hypothetical protein
MGNALTSQLASAASTSAIISSINASLLSHSALKKRATCVPTSTPYASKHSSPLSCLSCASVYCGKSLIICRLVSCILCYSLFALLLLSLLYRLLFLCQHLFKLYFTFISSCCSRVVLVAIGSNISPHICKPQFSPCKTHANLHTGTHVAHHARLVPTLGAPRVGTNVATQAILVPLPMLARMLHPMQNPCQLWTWHECCNTSKTRANFCHARVVPIVIHRLSTGCPMQNSCQLCALARLVPTLDMQKSCQC